MKDSLINPFDGLLSFAAYEPINTDSLWIRVVAFLFVLGLCAFFFF